MYLFPSTVGIYWSLLGLKPWNCGDQKSIIFLKERIPNDQWMYEIPCQANSNPNFSFRDYGFRNNSYSYYFFINIWTPKLHANKHLTSNCISQ